MSDLAIAVADERRRVQVDRAMIYAVFASGTAAGAIVSPVFWIVTPIVALSLMWAGRRVARPQLEHLDEDPSQMPMRVELAVHDAVSKLPSGDARRLLGEVVRQARPLFGMTSSNFDALKDDEARRGAADLVLAACDTALELSRLDTLLASGARVKKGTAPTAEAELNERYAGARAMFAKRLADAANALGALYASGVEHGTPASDLVADLATELSADAAARSAAKVEIDELLPRS